MAQRPSSHRLLIGSVSVEVTHKPINNLHLSVVPPDGSVRISAPLGMSPEHVRAYAIGKLAWIRRQQARFSAQPRETPRLVVERESHRLWGQRLLLHIEERPAPPRVDRQPRRLVLGVRPGTSPERRRALLEQWFRQELRRQAQDPLDRWATALAVQPQRLFVQAMTRRWGSCTPRSSNLRLNTRLVHAPPDCLDYVVLHELCHLRVRNHGPAFQALLDQHMPLWRERRRLLAAEPLLAA